MGQHLSLKILASMNMKPRPSKSLRRRKSYKTPREKVLIVCEGEKTEPNYFLKLVRDWRLTSVKVMGKECGSEPISVVNFAIEKDDASKKVKGEIPYKQVWCIMDVEIPKHLSLDQAIDKARAHGFKFALSNPCFEYWYILHFSKSAPYMNSNEEVLDNLKNYFPNYIKGNIDILSTLLPLTEDAINNSKLVIKVKNYENDFGDDLRKCNPSTHVHLLVEYLKNMKQ
jgi:hypothetical protein